MTNGNVYYWFCIPGYSMVFNLYRKTFVITPKLGGAPRIVADSLSLRKEFPV